MAETDQLKVNVKSVMIPFKLKELADEFWLKVEIVRIQPANIDIVRLSHAYASWDHIESEWFDYNAAIRYLKARKERRKQNEIQAIKDAKFNRIVKWIVIVCGVAFVVFMIYIFGSYTAVV